MRMRRGLVASGLLSALLLFGASAVDSADRRRRCRPGGSRRSMSTSTLTSMPTSMTTAASTWPRTWWARRCGSSRQRTAENAARIQRETGVRPGTARPGRPLAADPGQSGSWSPVVGTPVVPVFEAVLPNGKVLIWDSVGDNPAESYPDHSFTRAMVWNPADNTYKRVDLQGTNIFCAGFAHLANGNILIAGGNANAKLAGTVRTYVFNWQTETWTRGNDMAAARWYPVGGGNGERRGGHHRRRPRDRRGVPDATAPFARSPASRSTARGSIRSWARARTPSSGSSARTPPGTPSTPRETVSSRQPARATASTGTTGASPRTTSASPSSSGGGNITEGGVANVPTRTAVVVNSNTGLAPSVASTGSLSTGRRQLNATLLADGSVLATGGMTSAATSGLVDLNNAATAAERWDPATGQWTVLASASRIRQYHSTAVLLPDGRVMTGGGGICGVCMAVGYLEKNIEYFTPPYLYKKDGSGQLAARPVISTAPASVGINANFTISSASGGELRKVALVGLGDVTHGVDQGQRYVPLKFSASGTTLTVTGPPNGGVAPPGYYMLFVVDAAGVPSVAKMVQVAKGPNPVMSPVKNSTGRCIDVPSSATAIRTYLQAYNCNNTKAQALTRLPDDNSMRVLGNCLDVPSRNFVTGQRSLDLHVQQHDRADLAVRFGRHDPADREYRAVSRRGVVGQQRGGSHRDV